MHMVFNAGKARIAAISLSSQVVPGRDGMFLA